MTSRGSSRSTPSKRSPTASTSREAGAPTEEGLFSKTIFGLPGSKERRTRWGWIDLGIPYLHPIVYKIAIQLDTKLPLVVSGLRYVKVNKAGELVEDEENGWTGMDELAKRWSSIRWSQPGQSPLRTSRASFLDSMVKRQVKVFLTKWIVTPALYRDYEAQAQHSRSNILDIPAENDLYRKIILSSNAKGTGLSYSDSYRRLKVQDTLVEIYDLMIGKVVKKHGVLQDKLLGKGVDYGVWGVISGPKVSNAQTPGDQEVPFGYIGVPLYLLINLFQPLVVKELGDLLFPFKAGQTHLQVYNPKTDTYRAIEVPESIREEMDPVLFRRWISRYMKDKSFRTEKVGILVDKKEYLIPVFGDIFGRPITMTDLFYIVARNVIQGKHILLTRYPIDHFQSVNYVKPKILTTESVIHTNYGGVDDPSYPNLYGGESPGYIPQWVDSIRINNAYTASLGADFDGDRVKLIGILSHEANEEAERIMQSITNYVDSAGSASRTIGNEGVLTLYSLTK